MNKDEMKNKISMALKDPILQQGFEIICKKNADLEGQIEKMKKVLELAYKSLCRYETNINGIGITITAESEKELFCNWLKDVEHLIGKE